MRLLLLALCSSLACSHAQPARAPAGAIRELRLRPEKPPARSDGRADLLAGRLSIIQVSNALDAARSHDLMAAPPSSFSETRLFAESSGRKFVVLAQEMFVRAPADLPAAVATVMDERKYPVTPLALADSGLSAVAFGPLAPDFSGQDPEAGFVLGAIVAQSDGSLQSVYFFANPAAVKDACTTFGATEGCRALASTLAASIQAGPRKLDRSGGPKKLGDLIVTLPAGWTAAPQAGPDFYTVQLFPMRTLTEPAAAILFYVGGWPQRPHGRAMGSIDLLGHTVSWMGRPGKYTSRSAQAPMASGEKLDVHESAADPGDLKLLDSVVESMEDATAKIR